MSGGIDPPLRLQGRGTAKRWRDYFPAKVPLHHPTGGPPPLELEGRIFDHSSEPYPHMRFPSPIEGRGITAPRDTPLDVLTIGLRFRRFRWQYFYRE
jgi:hypothetical protein